MRQYFTRKRIVYMSAALIILIGVVFLVVKALNGSGNVVTQNVVKGDLSKTILATGQVISSTDIDLNFKNPGLVESVFVKVGDKVKEGDVLANLVQRDQAASVTQAQGSLAQAEANYDKLIAGADTPEVNIAKSSLNSAQISYNNAFASYNATKFQQDSLVRNAQLSLLNAGLEAKRNKIVDGEITATISGSYRGTEEGSYEFESVFEGTGFKVRYSGIESGVSANYKKGIPVALGTKGLYVTFSTDGSFSGNPRWTVNIPNTESSTYLANLNNYNAAVQARDIAMITAENTLNTTKASLDTAEANLNQTLAAARPEDVAVAQAQILSAEGQLEAALAQLENTVIRAPGGGTITAINIDEGEQSKSTEASIVLKDLENLYVEANIAEANISEVKLGQEVKFTFDALGEDKVFVGKVATIDPASTLVSGIVNYKIKASLDKTEEIKPGFTANLTIISESKQNVLAVPERAVLDKDGKKVVRVVTDAKTKEYAERLVSTGIKGDGAMIEITSGLEAEQEIVTDIKK